MLRGENTRAGFEAKADMLSITGMTLDQFADLMQGLGYKAEKAERAKVKATPEKPVETAEAETAVAPVDQPPAEADAEPPVAETPDTKADEGAASAESETAVKAEPELEVFYTFTWGRPARPAAQTNRRGGGERPQGKGKPGQKGKRGGPKHDKHAAEKFSARPPKPEKKIDPDNPFAAALMGLRDNK
jgi:ATP-dependent RNA helicase SUPV3L1/SUV3